MKMGNRHNHQDITGGQGRGASHVQGLAGPQTAVNRRTSKKERPGDEPGALQG
jgi:hypothetical protein